MNTLTKTLLCASIALSAGGAFAQDTVNKKGDQMMKNETMTMKDCQKHMAMSQKAGASKDDAMMKKDAICTDMMKKDGMAKDGMHKDGMMKKGDSASEPMGK